MKRTTSPTELLLQITRSSRVPLRVQLEGELRRAMQTGRIEAGALLPSTRTLAAELDLARGVVVEAVGTRPASDGGSRRHRRVPFTRPDARSGYRVFADRRTVRPGTVLCQGSES